MGKFQSLKIVVDSREQKPYEFDGYSTVIQSLRTGDYSVYGLENYISIERKSLGDIVKCLSYERTRFEHELYRAKSLEYFALVIEGSLSNLIKGQYRSEMRPKAVVQSLMTFSVRYNLPIFFAENREYGAMITKGLLVKYAREIEKKWIGF